MKNNRIDKFITVAVLAAVFSVFSTLSYAGPCLEGEKITAVGVCVPCQEGEPCFVSKSK